MKEMGKIGKKEKEQTEDGIEIQLLEEAREVVTVYKVLAISVSSIPRHTCVS